MAVTSVNQKFAVEYREYGGLVKDYSVIPYHWHVKPIEQFTSAIIYNVDGPKYYSDVVSVSGGYTQKQVFYRYRPRKPFVLSLPQRPTYKPPVVKPFLGRPLTKDERRLPRNRVAFYHPTVFVVVTRKFRDRREGEAATKYRRAYLQFSIRQTTASSKRAERSKLILEQKSRQYEIYKAETERLKALYEASYAVKLARYRKRLDSYYRIRALVMRGTPARTPRSGRERQWHPYSRTRIVDAGVSIDSTVYIHQKRIGTCSHGWATVSNLNPKTLLIKKMTSKGIKRFADYSPSMLATSETLVASLLLQCDKAAIARISPKISEEKMHIANFIAERAQTIDMLATVVRKIASIIKAKKTLLGTLRDVIGSSKGVADSSLAFQFGVMPLLMDAHALGEGLAQGLDEHLVRIKVVEKRSDAIYSGKNQTIVTVTVSYTLEFRVDNAMLRELGKWGLINPLEIAWELTPWSFVIDWILPIGAGLEAMSAQAGLTFVRGCRAVTTSEYNYVDYVKSLTGMDANGMSSEEKSSGYHTKEVKTRTLLSACPITLPKFEFTNPLSIRHLASAIPLLVQLRH